LTVSLLRRRPSRARLARLLFAALVAMAGAVAAGAQEEEAAAPGPIVTDRPTDSASPALVPRRTLQIEAGYKFTRTDDGSGRTDTHEVPDLLARFGITERVEARLTATGWTFRDATSGDEDGFNDVSLGAKFALGEGSGRRPRTSLLGDVSLPVGQAAFTDDYVIPKVLFLAEHGLTGGAGLIWNLGPSFVSRKMDDRRRTDVVLNYAIALSGAVGGPWSLFGEVYGNFDFGSDSSDSHTVQTGTTVLLGRTFQLDFRVGCGLVSGVPDWLAGAGLAFRLPR
jgi:hypothetical protein